MKNSNPDNFRKFPKTSIAEFNFSEVTRPKPAILCFIKRVFTREPKLKLFFVMTKNYFILRVKSNELSRDGRSETPY